MKVHLRTKGKAERYAQSYACNRCDQPIVAGEKYFEWKHNKRPTSRRHEQHGRPRTSELCTGKMSGVYAAIEWVEDAIAHARSANDASGLEDALNSAAESVREVAQEYEDNRSNMPESLQEGSTGLDMQEKCEALNEFADSLENAASETADWDMDTESPEPGEECSEDCAVNEVNEETGEPADENASCTCGRDELEAAKEEWENERDEKLEAAFDAAENALQELSL